MKINYSRKSSPSFQRKQFINPPSIIYRTQLNSHMKNWELYDRGFAYNLVAVFGSQSTGKSKPLISYSGMQGGGLIITG